MSNTNLTITLTRLPATKEVLEDYAEFIDWDEIRVGHVELIPTQSLRDHCPKKEMKELAFDAAKQGKYNVFVKLIEAGVDPKLRRLFTYALDAKSSKIIRFLVKKGVDISESNEDSCQYLMGNSQTIIKFLITKGFPTNKAYYYAICEENWKSINTLLELGVDINQDNAVGTLSLMCKQEPEYNNLNEDFYNAFNNILKHYPLKIHERTLDYNMNTPLMDAVSSNNPRLVQVLIDAGSDIYMYNRERHSVYNLAKRHKGEGVECINILQRRHEEIQKNAKIKKELK